MQDISGFRKTRVNKVKLVLFMKDNERNHNSLIMFSCLIKELSPQFTFSSVDIAQILLKVIKQTFNRTSIAQSVASLTADSGVASLNPSLAT